MKSKFVYRLTLAIIISIQPFWFSQAQADGRTIIALPGHASTTEGTNSGVSDVYSNLEMKFDLATKDNAAPCEKRECQKNKVFDKRVQHLGKKLALTAYKKHPDLKERVKGFQFSVANKVEAGTASNAKGDIVLFRGLQHLKLTDKAMQFLIAREMGHVIAKHHNKNTTAKLIISALTTAIFPVAGVVSFAASSSTTYLGGKVAMLNVKPKQRLEADNIALDLTNTKKSGIRVVINALPKETAATDWSEGLRLSRNNLARKLQRRNVVRNDVLVQSSRI